MIKYLEQNGCKLPYVIIVSNNKNTYFKFKPEYIEVNKSKYHSEETVVAIINDKFKKFYNKFQTLSKNSPNENEIMIEGKTYQLEIVYQTKFTYEFTENKIIVTTKMKDVNKIKAQIYRDYLLKMITLIEQNIKTVLQNNNIKERPIIIGYYKTKFGSYHRVKDEIKLNYVLAKVDINFLYYVIMHEYAHTRVFNHSKDFYKLLEKLMPDYRYYDKNLKKVSIWT